MASTDTTMIYLIFTDEGLAEAEADIRAKKADLWVNPGLLSAEKQQALASAGISVSQLSEHIDATNEKAVLSALAYVEKLAPKKEIFVEYL